MSKKTYNLFNLLGTKVTAEPTALLSPILFGIIGGLIAGPRPWLERLKIGALVALAYEKATFIHVIGHILSSQAGNAPMDRFHLAPPMPRTIYENQDVSPQAHRMRAIGGPIASIVAAILMFLTPSFGPFKGLMQQAKTIGGIVNLLLGLGSLAPLPFIDGGTILKWTLVEQGHAPSEADRKVQQTNLGFGIVTSLIGGLLALFKKWPLAGLFLQMGMSGIGIGLGKIDDKGNM